jgi:hypothetical protein
MLKVQSVVQPVHAVIALHSTLYSTWWMESTWGKSTYKILAYLGMRLLHECVACMHHHHMHSKQLAHRYHHTTTRIVFVVQLTTALYSYILNIIQSLSLCIMVLR